MQSNEAPEALQTPIGGEIPEGMEVLSPPESRVSPRQFPDEEVPVASHLIVSHLDQNKNQHLCSPASFWSWRAPCYIPDRCPHAADRLLPRDIYGFLPTPL